jgi:hypothetical protein
MATAPRPNETWFTEAAPAKVIGLPVLVGAVTTPVEAIVEEATPDEADIMLVTREVVVAGQTDTVTVTTSSGTEGAAEVETPADVDKLTGGGMMVEETTALLVLE